ncbi:aldo/keto reductase [Aquiluna borgnonia]|uniref:Aldo/keto reductase n=1 Tax=Aquiluna borgnonia TaxID=2499157 RepID=A0A7D4TKW8_9MICO|nr:aldo/keto reductase [Aquiluna borgnonia]QKJ25672.1 aldo/keto reductase [Aquiluna borgnonia]
MKYRNFGNTDWQVSEIAFGGWQLGGTWGPVDDSESIRTLLHAYEQGINFVDTAELYGDGRSESVIGQSLRKWDGGQIYVATKVRPIRWPDPDEDRPEMRGRYPRWYLRENIEGSLRRLGVERLDLLQLHCWAPDLATSLDWLETINELRLEGKIDQVGVSLRDYRPNEGIVAAELRLVSSVQVIFNLFEQRPATEGLFEACAKTNTAAIARVPMDSGSLSGMWTESTPSTWMENSVQSQLFGGDRFAVTLERIERLKGVVRPYFESLAEAAIRYSLSSPSVSSTIPGMSNIKSVDRNVAYSDGQQFPEELLEKIAEFNWPRNYYKISSPA